MQIPIKIVIDPGHGGYDSGAIGPSGLLEKDVNLSIALKLKGILESYNIEVIMTRTDDSYISLDKRVQIANDSNVDYFISIHNNSFSSPSANGTETYAYSTESEGNELANSIQSNLVQAIGLADRGVKYNSMQVVRETTITACLVEVAFINNPVEEKLLKQDEFLERVVVGIVKGVLEHLEIEYTEKGIINISEWAVEAMEWGMDLGLTDGTNPKESLTLERMITVLYRYDKLRK